MPRPTITPGLTAPGTLTSADFNTDGTSEQDIYNPSSNSLDHFTGFSGADKTGTDSAPGVCPCPEPRAAVPNEGEVRAKECSTAGECLLALIEQQMSAAKRHAFDLPQDAGMFPSLVWPGTG